MCSQLHGALQLDTPVRLRIITHTAPPRRVVNYSYDMAEVVFVCVCAQCSVLMSNNHLFLEVWCVLVATAALIDITRQ